MSDTKTRRSPATGNKPRRPVGPRDVYILFNEGTDPAFVAQVQAAIANITMNGRALLRHLQGGAARPFLTYKVHVEPRSSAAND